MSQTARTNHPMLLRFMFLFGTALLLSNGVFQRLALAQSTETVQTPRAAASVKQVNERAEAFVKQANLWMNKRAAVDLEIDRSTTALVNACFNRHQKEAKGNGSADPPAAGMVSDLRAQPDGDLAALLEQQKKSVSSLKLQFADEINGRCSGVLRAPGIRNERCLILEMGAQWATQSEQLIDFRLRASESSRLSIQRMTELEGSSCLDRARLSELRTRMKSIVRASDSEANQWVNEAVNDLNAVLSARK